MTHAAPLVAPQPALAAALTELLGGDLLAHVFTVDEDSITVDREAVSGVMISLRDNLEYQQLMEIAGVDYPDRAARFDIVYHQIGRASCRSGVCEYEWIPVGAVALQKKK